MTDARRLAAILAADVGVRGIGMARPKTRQRQLTP